MLLPRTRYEKRKERYSILLNKQEAAARFLSNLRLFASLLGLVFTGILFKFGNYTWSGALIIITVALFIILVNKHNRIMKNINHTANLININKISLKRIEGEWKNFSDDGEEFCNENHRYSEDLDIFGKGSLFQWINTTKTYLGRLRLRAILSMECDGKEEVYKRQEAVIELSENLTWRQNFMALGMKTSQRVRDPEQLFKWVDQQYELYKRSWVQAVVRILPIITITLIILRFIIPGISYHFPLFMVILQIIALRIHKKERNQALNTVYRYENSIRMFSSMLRAFENKKFKSELLVELQYELIRNKNVKAYKQIEKLTKIADMISNRNNLIYSIVNILLLWDYHNMIILERWKEESGTGLKKWLTALGEIEALSSLSVIRHDNPDWALPKIHEEKPLINAEAVGHPLITKGRICNNLKNSPDNSILLITGSNMSGKSTFLRTAGINLVLAYAGAPACAKKFTCSIMSIYTCMRVSDNLEKNISSFYAEILRIKMIVKAAKTEKRLFFLLDEIFKGTNSKDRHIGAKILIKQLSEEGAIGLVSTHDLELGELEKESSGKIKNYHFNETYKDNEICFDYKIKPGISTTTNALYLIKLAGIDVLED